MMKDKKFIEKPTNSVINFEVIESPTYECLRIRTLYCKWEYNYIDCHYTRTGTHTFVIVLSRWEEFSYSVTILLAYYNIELCYCYGFLKTAY